MGFNSLQLAAFHTADLDTLAKLAFSVSYQPGINDDVALRALADAVFVNMPVTPGVIACLRRFHFEAYSISANELRSRLEVTSETAPRKLATAERSARSDRQAAKLVGLVIADQFEPSHALVDLA